MQHLTGWAIYLHLVPPYNELKISAAAQVVKIKKKSSSNTKDQKACGGRQWGIRGEPCPIFIFPPLSSSPLGGKLFFFFSFFFQKRKGGRKTDFSLLLCTAAMMNLTKATTCCCCFSLNKIKIDPHAHGTL